MTHVTYRLTFLAVSLQADCQEPGSAPELHARLGYLYFFISRIVEDIEEKLTKCNNYVHVFCSLCVSSTFDTQLIVINFWTKRNIDDDECRIVKIVTYKQLYISIALHARQSSVSLVAK